MIYSPLSHLPAFPQWLCIIEYLFSLETPNFCGLFCPPPSELQLIGKYLSRLQPHLAISKANRDRFPFCIFLPLEPPYLVDSVEKKTLVFQPFCSFLWHGYCERMHSIIHFNHFIIKFNYLQNWINLKQTNNIKAMATCFVYSIQTLTFALI